jgi:hypothetical protein
MKPEPKSLGVSLGAVIRLETIVSSIWSNMVAINQMMRKSTCA